MSFERTTFIRTVHKKCRFYWKFKYIIYINITIRTNYYIPCTRMCPRTKTILFSLEKYIFFILWHSKSLSKYNISVFFIYLDFCVSSTIAFYINILQKPIMYSKPVYTSAHYCKFVLFSYYYTNHYLCAKIKCIALLIIHINKFHFYRFYLICG